MTFPAPAASAAAGSSISGDAALLGSFKQPSGKLVDAWLMGGSLELADFRSNSFQLEWPPKSGKMKEFPEVDQWGFTPVIANDKIVRGQRPILAAALEHIRRPVGS